MKAHELLSDSTKWANSNNPTPGTYDIGEAIWECYGEDNYEEIFDSLATVATVYFNRTFTRWGLIDWNSRPTTNYEMVIDLLVAADV
jgi:hypothetical protein